MVSFQLFLANNLLIYVWILIPCRESQDQSAIDKQTLGEEVYSLVLDLKPNQCAAKITGK